MMKSEKLFTITIISFFASCINSPETEEEIIKFCYTQGI